MTSFNTNSMFNLRYPELYVEEHWQNRPVIWFVAKREGYNGMMQNNNLAEDSTDVILKELLTNGKNTLSKISPLRVYPNPFREYITIESPIDDEILIQELSGRVVNRQKISKGKTRIQTENLSNGFYFIHFVEQEKSFKLINQ